MLLNPRDPCRVAQAKTSITTSITKYMHRFYMSSAILHFTSLHKKEKNINNLTNVINRYYLLDTIKLKIISSVMP